MPCLRRSSATWARSSRLVMLLLRSAQAGELLQQVPVFETLFARGDQRRRRIPVFVEVFGEAALASREGDEVHRLARLRVGVPIVLHVRIPVQADALLHARPFARIVDEDREGTRVGGEFGLVLGHVVADAVLGLERESAASLAW